MISTIKSKLYITEGDKHYRKKVKCRTGRSNCLYLYHVPSVRGLGGVGDELGTSVVLCIWQVLANICLIHARIKELAPEGGRRSRRRQIQLLQAAETKPPLLGDPHIYEQIWVTEKPSWGQAMREFFLQPPVQRISFHSFHHEPPYLSLVPQIANLAEVDQRKTSAQCHRTQTNKAALYTQTPRTRGILIMT